MENTNLQSILDKAQKLQSLAERAGASISDGGSYDAGRAAGEKIALNQGVAGRGSVGQLA